MARSDRPGAPSSFWRCDRCATPNPLTAYLTHCIGCGAPRPALVPPRSARPAGGKSAAGPTVMIVPRGGRGLVVASWAYAVLVLAALALIRWEGDRWWSATLLMFAPRWAFLLPVVALMAIAGWRRRRALWALQGATLLVIAGPLMDVSLPVERLWVRPPGGPRLRVMTLNLGARDVDTERLIGLIERERVEVVCFQEGGIQGDGYAEAPALRSFFGKDWHRSRDRSIASRFPIVEEVGPPDVKDGDSTFWRARLARVKVRTASGAEFLVASIHLPSMGYAFEALGKTRDLAFVRRHIAWRWAQLEPVVTALGRSGDLPTLVGGDFNTPADSPMMDLFGLLGLRSGFREAGWGYAYTRPASWPWVGIDHILAGPEWTFTRCWVGPDVGSDHLPLLAEVVAPGPPVPRAR